MKVQEADAARLRKTLVDYCYGLTGSLWDAEDLAQETYMKALPFMDTVGSMANPSAYLSRMAKNRWIDQLRRQKRASVLEKEAARTERPEAAEIDSEPVLAMLLRQLTPVQRAVFLLREAMNLSAKETASLLQLSEGAVKAALHRARAAVRDWREREFRSEWETFRPSEEEQTVLQAYVMALQEGNAQAIASLMYADEQGKQTAAIQIRHQLRQQPVTSHNSATAPNATTLAA